MKRFAVFYHIISFYPESAMGDFVKSFDTKEEAELLVSSLEEEKGDKNDYKWIELVDMNEYE